MSYKSAILFSPREGSVHASGPVSVCVCACVCVMMAGQMPYCLSVELFAWCWAQWAWPSDPAARTRDVSRLPKESTLIFMLWVFAVLQLVMKHAHTHTHTVKRALLLTCTHTPLKHSLWISEPLRWSAHSVDVELNMQHDIFMHLFFFCLFVFSYTLIDWSVCR